LSRGLFALSRVVARPFRVVASCREAFSRCRKLSRGLFALSQVVARPFRVVASCLEAFSRCRNLSRGLFALSQVVARPFRVVALAEAHWRDAPSHAPWPSASVSNFTYYYNRNARWNAVPPRLANDSIVARSHFEVLGTAWRGRALEVWAAGAIRLNVPASLGTSPSWDEKTSPRRYFRSSIKTSCSKEIPRPARYSITVNIFIENRFLSFRACGRVPAKNIVAAVIV